MRPRLAKELHPLLLPWLIAAVAAGAMPLLALLVGPAEGGTFTLFLLELITFAFFGALAVIAGLSFGAEFQQRTLGLLVSQPIERSRLWKEKMLALLAAATSIGLILWLSWGVGGLLLAEWGVWPDDREWVGKQLQRYFPDQALVLAATWIVATVCSSGFWSLLARSTIGGMVLSAASQGLLALGAVFALHQIYGTEFQFEDSIVTGVIIAAGLVYSATFLWLGWRKFALLELGDVSFGEGAPLSEALAGAKWWLGWLRCRPTGSLRNLMRKELRLLKPVFLIAAMFSGCWLVTLALLFLQPARKETFEAVFNVLTAIYMPLLAVLAGCVSLGEEKTLGLTAWHLTLPVSARRQWLVKLSIAAAAGAALGLVLPWFLAWMTVAKVEVGLIYLMHDQGDGVQMLLNGVLLLLVSELMFVMSFWAATLLANTVRAALTGVISLAGLGGCAALGAWCALQLGGLEKPLLLLVTAHFQLPPDFFWQLFLLPFLFLCLVTSISLTALAQSLVQFRRAQAQTGALLKYLAILAATAFVLSFWCSDFEVSGHGSYNAQLEADLSNALRALPGKELDFSSRRSRVVTLRELEQTGKLSHPTRAWLRNTSITYRPSGTQFIPAPERKVYEASIMFPNGRSCVLAYTEQGSLGWGAPELSSKPNHHN